MATGSSTKQQWCSDTRQVIGGRARRGPETRLEQMAMPDPKAIALTQRMIRLKAQMEELKGLAPDKANPLLVRLEVVQRSLSAGNLDTVETPLGQLETVTGQLLLRAKPPTRTAPPPRTPPPTVTPPPVVRARPVSAPYLKKLIDAAEKKINAQFLREGGGPATALQVRLNAIKTDFADVAKHADCLTRINVLGPEIDTLALQNETARVAAAKIKVGGLATAPVDRTRGEALKRQVDATTATKKNELQALLEAGSETFFFFSKIKTSAPARETMLEALAEQGDEQYIKKVKAACDAALAVPWPNFCIAEENHRGHSGPGPSVCSCCCVQPWPSSGPTMPIRRASPMRR